MLSVAVAAPSLPKASLEPPGFVDGAPGWALGSLPTPQTLPGFPGILIPASFFHCWGWDFTTGTLGVD